MTSLLYVAGGGAIGSVLRYLLTSAVHGLFGRTFPYGTLSVNIIGALLIGFLSVILGDKVDTNAGWRMLLIVGLLGGFTTFSAFSLETMHLIQGGQPGKAVLNVLLSIGLCLVGCWLGIIIGKKF